MNLSYKQLQRHNWHRTHCMFRLSGRGCLSCGHALERDEADHRFELNFLTNQIICTLCGQVRGSITKPCKEYEKG